MKKGLRAKIINEFQKETPNLREEIIQKCQNESQVELSDLLPKPTQPKKLKVFTRLSVAFLCVILLGVGIFAGYTISKKGVPTLANTFVYIDVNPSIELSLDENNLVVDCIPLNEDAEEIIHDMDFKGVELKIALNAIIGAMYVNGYIDQEENSMLVSVDGEKDQQVENLLTDITEQINQMFSNSGIECAIIAQSVPNTPELSACAEQNGISIGKMYLVEKMANEMGNTNSDNIKLLCEMSIRELNLMYSTRPNKDDKPSKNDEILSGHVGGYISESQAIDALFAYLNITKEDVERYIIQALPSEYDHRVIYAVTIKLKNEESELEYEVDCVTGLVAPGRFDEYGRVAPPSEFENK